MVDPAKDLFVVRLSDPDVNRRIDILRGYQLSTGKEMGVSSDALESSTARSSFRLTNSVSGQKAPELSSFPNQPLKLLGQFSFQDSNASSASAIRDVICFDFDDQGRIGFIRRESSKRFTFVQIAPDGSALKEVDLPIPPTASETDTPKTAWLEADRWIVCTYEFGEGGKAFAWLLGVAKGEFRPIPNFASPPVQSLHRARNGGFVALVTTRLKYSMVDELIAFDETGKIRWRIKENSGGGPGSLFSPEDVAVTTKGEIAVVNNIQKRVQLFGEDGGFLEVLDLGKSWGRKPNYPTTVAADNSGGFVIKDFNGKPPLIWMGADRKVRRQMTPKAR